jgi:hypothetical protein
MSRKDPHHCVVGFRVSQHIAEQIAAAAERELISVSAFVRRACAHELIQLGYRRPSAPKKERLVDSVI